MALLSNLLIRLRRGEEAVAWMLRALRCCQQSDKLENTPFVQLLKDLYQIRESQELDTGVVSSYENMYREIMDALW